MIQLGRHTIRTMEAPDWEHTKGEIVLELSVAQTQLEQIIVIRPCH
jgi:hypothetical protein